MGDLWKKQKEILGLKKYHDRVKLSAAAWRGQRDQPGSIVPRRFCATGKQNSTIIYGEQQREKRLEPWSLGAQDNNKASASDSTES